MRWISQDLRIGARNLLRRPAFAAGVVVTLGLGIGAVTTVYSVVNGVLLRDLPYDRPTTLVTVGAVSSGVEWVDEPGGLQSLSRMSMPNYIDLRDRARSFERWPGSSRQSIR
jgi:putative ABC transport system permease protein